MDAYAKSLAIPFRKSPLGLLVARGTLQGSDLEDASLILAKPQTYMNRSGPAVVDLFRETGTGASDLLVVHDDLDLGLGRLQFKTRGGDGGHRGIRSIIASLKTPQFFRLRIGIGRPPAGLPAAECVLSDFLPEEKPVFREAIVRAVAALDCFLTDGPERAMNRYNPS